jgi:hypothetical protein
MGPNQTLFVNLEGALLEGALMAKKSVMQATFSNQQGRQSSPGSCAQKKKLQAEF